jgi:hypothetical protein
MPAIKILQAENGCPGFESRHPPVPVNHKLATKQKSCTGSRIPGIYITKQQTRPKNTPGLTKIFSNKKIRKTLELDSSKKTSSM